MYYVVHDTFTIPGIDRVFKRGDVIRTPAQVAAFEAVAATDATILNKATATTVDPEA